MQIQLPIFEQINKYDKKHSTLHIKVKNISEERIKFLTHLIFKSLLQLSKLKS